jgi:hypothetical protein
MHDMKARATGKLTINSEGNVATEKFSIAATSDVLSGGSLTLTVRPGFKPSLNAKDATNSNLLDAAQYTGLSNVSDFDMSIAKGGVDVHGQSVDLTLDMQRVGSASAANRLTVKTNVEQVGDVTATLSKAGFKTNDKASSADEAKINVNLNKFASEANADLTANVDYDIPSKNASVNIGYKNGDVSVKLKSSRSGAGDLSHKVNLGYTIEGIDAGLEINDKLSGKVTVSKDGFTLEVPVSKDGGVNHKEAKLEKSWSMDLA